MNYKEDNMASKIQDENRTLKKANAILEEQNKKYREAILLLENTINSLKRKNESGNVDNIELVEYDDEQCGRHK